MSYEFLAPLPEEAARLSSELLQALILRLPLALVSMSQDKLSLRWTNLAPRAEWPEDIDLSGDANGILVSIHVGTAEQRRSLLDVLADEIMKASGISVKFEEQ